MEVRRTVPVALDVDSNDAALLEDTINTFLWCAQYVVDHAFKGEYVTTSKTTLDDETYDNVREKTGAELHYHGGDWMLHVHCKMEGKSDTSEKAPLENGTVLGVDLGVNNLAVASTGTFWMGDEFDHWRREYKKRRGSLHQCGTRWAHQNIRSVGRKKRTVQTDSPSHQQRTRR
jgi:transposase